MAARNKNKKLSFASVINVDKTNKFLALIFFIIWILIGLLILLFIWANVKQGAFDGLFRSGAQAPAETQTPNEATIPGIGKVNVECVQSSLANDTIGKIVQEGNTSKLTDAEKGKLEPCIIEREETTPSTSPTN